MSQADLSIHGQVSRTGATEIMTAPAFSVPPKKWRCGCSSSPTSQPLPAVWSPMDLFATAPPTGRGPFIASPTWP